MMNNSSCFPCLSSPPQIYFIMFNYTFVHSVSWCYFGCVSTIMITGCWLMNKEVKLNHFKASLLQLPNLSNYVTIRNHLICLFVVWLTEYFGHRSDSVLCNLKLKRKILLYVMQNNVEAISSSSNTSFV